ncbi:DNA repair protein RecO [Maribellus sediminis]|uniref:DNA repair protein RecO n=1 Tax=Maribellus sediminis TaxID=2696285 RepID=UPI00142F90D3|nr:DNA repair protein RecO [Maribellus sediminis]
MLAATEGIVLHHIKYGESSVIATIFTKEFGRQSYIVNASRSRKAKNKAGLLQPLYLLDLEVYQKQSREIQRIKEFKSLNAYQNIPFDIAKSTQAIFLAEMLYKTIHEQESYPELYEFIKSALLYFDLMEGGWQNFHLYFLFRLTEYFGFLPDTQKVGFESWFDMKKGAIVPFEPSHPLYANKDVTKYLVELSVLKISDLEAFKVSRSMRDSLLQTLVDYYQLHFENLGEVKSLNVLREVFH